MVSLIHPPMTNEALVQITRQEVERYVGFSPQAELYPILDDEHQTYAVAIIPHWPRQYPPDIVVMARVVEDKVIIEVETTDKPLIDALMINGGIPREQIVLAYAGETPSNTGK
ncbi:MAG: XisI protein [Anaerolineae bacterium]|nr:MAG: XisI protein [Anaerolineae bacterium]